MQVFLAFLVQTGENCRWVCHCVTRVTCAACVTCVWRVSRVWRVSCHVTWECDIDIVLVLDLGGTGVEMLRQRNNSSREQTTKKRE